MVVVSLRPAYAGTRMAAWWVLWLGVHLDAFVNRSSRGRGWRLHRGILACLTSEVVFQSIHLAVAVRFANNDDYDFENSNTFKARIFFSAVAESVFLCLILLVSAGYCILRESLGDNLRKVIVIPVVYGATSMTADYILLSAGYEEIISEQSSPRESEDDDIDSDDLKALVFVLCLLVKAAVFVAAWIFVFDNLNREIRQLKGGKDDESPSDVEEAEMNEGYTRPELQDRVEVSGEREEAAEPPKTVAEVIGDQAKLLLLQRFRNLLVLYICFFLMANILPIYIGSASVEKIQSIVTVCENLNVLGFLTALAFIFRPADDNPYLLLVDAVDAEGEPKEVTTELGVMSFEPPTPQQSTTDLPETQTSPGREEPAFALADDEDMELMSPRDETPKQGTTEVQVPPRIDPPPASHPSES